MHEFVLPEALEGGAGFHCDSLAFTTMSEMELRQCGWLMTGEQIGEQNPVERIWSDDDLFGQSG